MGGGTNVKKCTNRCAREGVECGELVRTTGEFDASFRRCGLRPVIKRDDLLVRYLEGACREILLKDDKVRTAAPSRRWYK